MTPKELFGYSTLAVVFFTILLVAAHISLPAFDERDCTDTERSDMTALIARKSH